MPATLLFSYPAIEDLVAYSDALPLAGGVALATAGNLSFLTEVMVNGTSRQRIGNSIYGQYGQHFTSGDGESFMIVALTGRHFRDLTEVTGNNESGCRARGCAWGELRR